MPQSMKREAAANVELQRKERELEKVKPKILNLEPLTLNPKP